MTAYVIADIEVLDEALMHEYVRAAEGLIERYGGRPLARSSTPLPQEGNWQPKTLVLLEFPNEEVAIALYNSPEYQALKSIRLRATTSNGIVLFSNSGQPMGQLCS